MELIDRNLISFRFYSRFRTFVVTKMVRPSEVGGGSRDKCSLQRGGEKGDPSGYESCYRAGSSRSYIWRNKTVI